MKGIKQIDNLNYPKSLRDWRSKIIQLYNQKCFVTELRLSGGAQPLEAHHLYSQSTAKARALDVNNGVLIAKSIAYRPYAQRAVRA